MITSYPMPALSRASRPEGAESRREPISTTGSWRYPSTRRSRVGLFLAALFSVALHAGLMLGVGRAPKKVALAAPSNAPIIRLVLPEIKDLEEPEPIANDDPGPPIEAPTFVPMQADLPGIPSPSDFVQQIDFSSFLERPDFSHMNVLAVPENFRGGTGKLAEKIGAIFDLADLDRIPEPLFQPAPNYPHLMRRDGIEGTVTVEFVVDTNGRAVNGVVFESLHPGFNDAALAGVQKWKFRPGIRGGRKVNTRMRVPISFRLSDS